MRRLSIIIIFLFILLLPLSNSLYSVEMSAGASTWYVWWKHSGISKIETDPALMYGPVLSIRFTDNWSLSGVFLYGKFVNNEVNSPNDLSTCKRYDSDLSLNYNINRYFKIFAGGKYLGFTWDAQNGSGYHWTAGPGLGAGATLPLTSNIFLLANISGMYSIGKDTSEFNNKTTTDVTETGFNSNISFAYYIASASTSINMGFRYQYIRCTYSTSNPNYKTERNNFYGVTLSAVYSFGS